MQRKGGQFCELFGALPSLRLRYIPGRFAADYRRVRVRENCRVPKMQFRIRMFALMRTWIHDARHHLCIQHGLLRNAEYTCFYAGREETCPLCKAQYNLQGQFMWLDSTDEYFWVLCGESKNAYLLALPMVCWNCRGTVAAFAKSVVPCRQFDCDIFPDVLRQIIGEYAFEKTLECRKCKEASIQV